MAIQAQLQVLLVIEAAAAVLKPSTGSNVDITKPPTFSREAGMVLEFLIVCRLYIRIMMRDTSVEKQVQ